MSETPCEWLDGLLNGDYDFTVYSRKNARAELAQLRASDIRTMEHCDVCGSLLALDADALEDVEPFCPYCEYQEAIIMISEREKTIESLRADLQAAQERIDQQARQLEAAREIIEACASLDRYISDAGIDDARAWIAANPAPEAEPQRCTCGMGDATMPEYHAKDCTLYRMAAPELQP